MSNLSDFTGGGVKPKLITTYTSGTGTYVPTENNARCLVRIQAGGAGGFTSVSGGGGGAMVEVYMRIPIAGGAYAVGAGGAVSANGSNSTFGQFAAMGGLNDASGLNVAMYGGVLSVKTGAVDADSVSFIGGQGLNGVEGGSGGNGSNPGLVAGFPINNTSLITTGFASISARCGNGQGNGSGGNSFYGKGGTAGNSPAAGNYGAGGGSNAAGLGGYIEIWDFGA